MGKDLKGKELGENLSQRKDGKYTARFTDRYGKRHQKYFDKLNECKKWLRDNKYLDEHTNINRASDTIVQTWYEYWIDIKEKTVRPNTVRNYKERYKRNIEPMIGNMLIKDVTPVQCQLIFNKMEEEGYKTSTMYQTRITLYNLFQFAVDSDALMDNPCKKTVKSNIGKESKERGALKVEEQREFLKASYGKPYDLQYRFLLQTGLRTGEMVALTWNDIDFKNKTLTVNKTMEYRYKVGEWRIGEPKSKSGYRVVPLTDEAIEILKLQKEKNKNIAVIQFEWKDIIFLCRKGTPVKNSTYDAGIGKITKLANIENFSMHTLRHTFATRCIEGGMKPKTLQEILGHSNINITMNLYVHITDEEKTKEIEAVQDVLKVI